jgi:hypothetical protein
MARSLGRGIAPALFSRLDPGTAGTVGFLIRLISIAVMVIVASLSLFYATLVSGSDRIMVPNSVVLNTAVMPLHEPERVELRARFEADTSPRRVQELLDEAVTVPTRYPPHIALGEVDRDEVVVRIVATPDRPSDGAELADQVLSVARRADGGESPAGDPA